MAVNQNMVIAKAIEDAARYHEESWDSGRKKYQITHAEAALRALPFNVELAGLVCLLLLACWSDALAWAEEVRKTQEAA